MKTTARNCLAAAALILATSAVQGADYPTTVQSFNPVGYWRLSESVSPPAPNLAANAGSLGTTGEGYPYPGTSIGQGQPGIVGTAFNFTNVAGGINYDANDAVDVPYNVALNPEGPFTLEFWANPSSRTTGDLVAPVSAIDINANRSGFLMYFDNTNKRWEWRTGGTAGYATTVDSPAGSAVVGAWQHVVGVWDGTNVLLYLNGVLAAAPSGIIAGRNWTPNKVQPFRLGGTQFPNRSYDGLLDEVAFYGTALSANSISNHYYVATNNPAGYAAAVLANSPVGYWHFDEPVYVPPAQSTLPVTVNSGTLGAVANGTNQPGLTAGAAGPPFAGFPASNLGTRGKFMAGNVNLGNPNGLNFAGPITMVAWVRPGNADGLRNILSHGYRTGPDQEVQLRINGGLYEVGSWSPGEGATSLAGRATTDIGNWVFLAGTFDGTDWRLYRYDQLIAGPTTGVSGALVMDAPWSIGSRGDTSADGRFSGAWIDEVAIFTNALTAAQIQQIFSSAQMSPVILVAPQAPSGTVYEGVNLSFSVEAAGNPTLLYQWTKNSAPIPGQTGTTLALNNVTTSATGTYAIVVTNNYGSVTSSFALTVVAGPPLLTLQPQSASRYAGATASFSVGAVGSPTLNYQWYLNTNTALGGATGTTYSKANIQAVDAGTYNCRVTNPLGNSNSAYATLTVVAAPTTPYPIAALADNPLGYWRLNEASGTVARDNWGGHDGVYNGAVALNQPGYSPLDSNTAARFSGQNIYVGSIGGIDFSGTTSTFTLEAWVNGPALQVAGTDANATIIGKGRGGEGAGGVNGWQFVLEVAGGKYQFRVQPASGTQGTATADVGPNGTWQHVVAVYDQAGGLMSLYVNGQPSGTTGAPPGTGPLASLAPVSIGAGLGGITPVFNMYFNGSIDEAAIYGTALSASQVRAHYCAQFGPGQRPLIGVQPSSVTEWVGWPTTLSVIAAGSCDITYQWYKGATPLTDGGTITGSQSSRLDIAGLAPSDAGNYSVTVANSVGSSNSAVAVVKVLATLTNAIPVPGLVLHLPFNGNITDASGRGNNGTGMRTTATSTNAATPNAGNPSFNYVSDGVLGQGLHYATATTPAFDAYFVTLGVRPDLKFGSNVNFSVAYWARFPVNVALGDLPFLCSARNSYGGQGYTFAPSYELGGWSYSMNGVVQLYGPDHLIDDGLWHQLVHTFDRTGLATTYLDGRLVDSRSAVPIGNLDNNNAVNIGQDPTGIYPEAGAYDIDDLGVWRRALTEVEARGLYVTATNGFSFLDISPSISAGPGIGQVTVTWQVGTLQSASNVAGSYTDVSGATSPYTITPTANTFYRTRY